VARPYNLWLGRVLYKEFRFLRILTIPAFEYAFPTISSPSKDFRIYLATVHNYDLLSIVVGTSKVYIGEASYFKS
jgi:hypothetical protein